MRNGVQCRWVPVVDESGRQRLEMRWAEPGTVTAMTGRTWLATAARAA